MVGGFGAWYVDLVPLLATPLAPAFFPIYPGYQPFLAAREAAVDDNDGTAHNNDEVDEDNNNNNNNNNNEEEEETRMLLMDIEAVLEDLGVLENLPPVMRSLVSDRRTNKVRAVPYYGDADVIFCPRDVLVGPDGSAGPPETYDQLLALLRRSERRYGTGLNVVSAGHMATTVLVAMHGGEFAQRVVYGEEDMSSDKMIEFGEKLVQLFATGLVQPIGHGDEFQDMFLFGTRGCMAFASNIYNEFEVERPAVFAEPFFMPHIPSATGPRKLTTKAGVGFPIVAFVPALSAQRDLGVSMLRDSIQARLDLAKRGPPFSADEVDFLGKSLLFFDRETLTSNPVFADALANYDAMSDLDYLVTALGAGSPPVLVDDHNRLFNTLFSATEVDIDPVALMRDLEQARIEKLHGRTLPPVVDTPAGVYDGPIVVRFSSRTEGAMFCYTTDGSEVGPDSAKVIEGRVVLDQPGKMTLRVAAQALPLAMSSEVALEFEIRIASSFSTTMLIILALAVVAVLVAIAGAAVLVHRRRKRGQFIDPQLVQLEQVIGIGGRSIVFFGKFRGASVAVKEFVSAAHLDELLKSGQLDSMSLTVGDLLSRGRTSMSGSALMERLRSDVTNSQEPLAGNAQQNARTRRANERQRGHEFQQETQLLSKIRHPNIVTFLAAYDSHGRRGIVLEFMSRGSLFEVVTSSANVLPWRQRISYARDGARGLAFLHAQTPPVLHRDVKSLNFLVGDHGQCAVSDFGFSTIFEEGCKTSTQMGTLPWTAPEVLRGEQYTQACDVYSFGIVLWELASRTAPSLGRTSAAIRTDTLSGVRPPVNSSWPEAVVDLMRRCWDPVPDKRPSFAQISDLLAQFYASLPEEQVEVDPFGIKTASGIVGEQRIKDMQMSLMQGTTPLPCHIGDVVVVVVEITNVPDMCKDLEAHQVASMLSDLFAKFERLGKRWGVCRFQSNGSKYVGLSHRHCPCDDGEARNGEWSPEASVCGYSLALHSSVQSVNEESTSVTPILKIGAHVGSLTFLMGNIHSVEIRGEAVSLASMMATTGLGGRVQVTELFHSRVARSYPGTSRPNVAVVGKGNMTTVILNTIVVAESEPSKLDLTVRSSYEEDEDEEDVVVLDHVMPSLEIEQANTGSDSDAGDLSVRL